MFGLYRERGSNASTEPHFRANERSKAVRSFSAGRGEPRLIHAKKRWGEGARGKRKPRQGAGVVKALGWWVERGARERAASLHARALASSNASSWSATACVSPFSAR